MQMGLKDTIGNIFVPPPPPPPVTVVEGAELPAARRAAERRVARSAGREQLKEKYAGDTSGS